MEYQDFDEDKQKAARRQGEAFDAALDLMRKDVDASASTEKGDYIISLLAEEAEGMYLPDGKNSVQWHVPDKQFNKHIEVTVQDRRDHRFIPGLEVEGRIQDKNSKELGEIHLPLLWHPFINHYGNNIGLPDDDDYLFAIVIKQPEFGRHDELNGKRFEGPVEVVLGPLHLQPGRKPHGAE